MPVFHSGHFRVFWYILFDAANRFDANLEDKEIVIISPWISDVTTHTSGWSDSSISSAFNPYGGGSIESLSDVLGRLVKLGYNVTVVTLSTTGKWLPKARNKHLDRERQFMNKVSRSGVNCMLRNNIHKKYVKTPFTTFSGSLNISFNGLSGRNQEGADLFFKTFHEQDYNQRKQGVDATLVGAKDYFSSSIPITTWSPPNFEIFPQSQIPELTSSHEESYPSVSGSVYPEMTPEGYLPPGKILSAEIGENEKLSMMAQCSQLIQRTAMWAVGLLADETLEGHNEKDIFDQLFDLQSEEDSLESNSEILPSIKAIRNLLLPSGQNQQLTDYLSSRLGLSDHPEALNFWRSQVGELLDGLEHLSNALAEDKTSLENAKILAALTTQFDNLSG
tara:strand:+ start:1915 stop:3087 length:1173 start_codon:yes stop_codon:yes gene_type:complete